VRVGVVILPDQRWSEAARRWRLAEQYGFDHAWTYDHLGWRSLVDGPWFDAAVTLTAAAGVTSTIRLGTMVASPHFRAPVPFARVVTALDDVSGGRFTLGVGAGTVGPAFDALVQGHPVLSDRARTDRFAEYLELLDRLLREDRVSFEGQYFSAVDARSTPGCVQSPRVPFVVAANGPRGRALAARYGQGWVTTGGAAQTLDEWWRTVAEGSERFSEAVVAVGRDPATVDRYVNLDSAPVYSLSSVAAFTDAAGRAAELGFTDVLTHWPRPALHEIDWYVGDEAVLETVAAEVLPGVRQVAR
jgi:alkanesulfonate monooxygenase SsuD/methylene tetrahydromethanopterin reductase-like flavin-dependent oxidoreductase (luciferase family)